MLDQLPDGASAISASFLDSYFCQSRKLHQGPFRRTDISATTAFKTIKDSEFLCQMSPSCFNIKGDFLWAKSHRTGFHAPTTMDARTKFA